MSTTQTQSRDFQFADLRQQFPLIASKSRSERLIYFDNAATTQKPRTVIDRISQYYKHENATTHRGVYALSQESTHEYEKVRTKCARFINAKHSSEIIFLRGTTEAINLVATCYASEKLVPGDEILISEIEHHANIVPWQQLCQSKGFKLKVVGVNDAGEVEIDTYKRLLNDKTKVVALTHVSNSLGSILPIKEMIELAHEKGAVVLIDGAQGAGHLKVDVQDLNADFYCFSGHKVYGPTGIGVLYGKKHVLNSMRPYQFGGAMIETVTFEKTTFADIPAKFEAGTQAIAQIIGLGTALDFLSSVGMNRIEAYETELLEYAISKMKSYPDLRFIGNAKKRSAIISFVMNGIHPHDIGTILDQSGIASRAGHHCAQPTMKRFGVSSTIRVSFGLYNNKEEIDLFIQALDEVKKVMK